MNNRIWNCKNPNQGKALKVLCVCSAGLLRSPTAANVLHREFGFNTRAVGITKEYALTLLEDVHLHWADEIVCMESWMAYNIEDRLERLNLQDKSLYALNVKDEYEYMDEELQREILRKYNEHNFN